MMMFRIWQLSAMALFLAAAAACAQPFKGESIAIADDKKGIGFDDLRYSSSLHGCWSRRAAPERSS
jgi:hypothetical protein